MADARDLRDRACVKGVDDLLSGPCSLGHVVLVVGGSQVLCALPRGEHLVVGGVGIHCRGRPCPLLLGEVLSGGEEDGLYPAEWVVLVSTVTKGVLLHATADVVDSGGAEFDHVERDDYVGVVELVLDRGLVYSERNQCCDFHLQGEAVVALTKPCRVRLPGPAGQQIHAACVRRSFTVAGEVDPFRPPPALVDVMPGMFIDSAAGDILEP